MMKRLYVLRHSKAGQTNKKILDDHERPLTQKGVDLCPLIGSYLAGQKPLPTRVLCSTATRAVQTAQHVLKAANIDVQVDYLSRLYLATVPDLFDTLRGLDDAVESVLLVGHNPGLQQLSVLLPNSGDRTLYREMKTNFPPGSLAVFDVHIEVWEEFSRSQSTLVDFKTKDSL